MPVARIQFCSLSVNAESAVAIMRRHIGPLKSVALKQQRNERTRASLSLSHK